MSGDERRKKILSLLEEGKTSISANKLAKEFLVTRQIIVADIALLRAAGFSIIADHKGYYLKSVSEGIIKRIAVKHGKDDVLSEFCAIVDNGGRVLDVIVEHEVYGKISVELNISSRYDADVFVGKINETKANPLSLLTEGLHIHTIVIKDEEAFLRIVNRLSELNILVETM